MKAATLINETVGKWSWWKEMLTIVAGCVIVSIGFVFFINPYNIVPGGVYGLGIVMHNIFPSVQVGTFGYMFDIPLLITAIFIFGRQFGGRTFFAACMTPGLMNIISSVAYPSREALRELDPSQLLGGVLDLSDHLMLTCVLGGAMIGLGLGLVVRSNATTGGTDIVAMIINRYRSISYGRIIFALDFMIIASSLLVGFSIDAAIYGYIMTLVFGYTVDMILAGNKQSNQIFIITPHYEEITLRLNRDLGRGVTLIESEGGYTHHRSKMVMVICARRETLTVMNFVRQIDPDAFMTVGSVMGVYGRGFQPIKL